ncbi:putative tetratricopeptide-like helical domain superfamily [Helianthus anomalus]
MYNAIEIIRAMEKNGVTPDEVSYGTLINGFCENGDLERACLQAVSRTGYHENPGGPWLRTATFVSKINN